MSSYRSEPHLRIDVKTSRFLIIFVVIAHGTAFLVAASIAATWYIKLALILSVVVSAYYSLFISPFLVLRHPLVLLFKNSANALIKFNGKGFHRAKICNDTYIHPWLVVLNLKLATGKRVSIPLLKDGMSSEQHRQLRVYLKIQGYRTAEKLSPRR